MKIQEKVTNVLNEYETSELQRILEAMERQEYYLSGYKNINGGYASAEAFNVELDGYYDEETDEETDAVEIELESGIQDMGSGESECNRITYVMGRNILANKDMSLEDKLKKIEEN